MTAYAMDRCDLVEATLSWGDNVLATKHVRPGQELTAGEGPGCDFMVPGDVLGGESFTLVGARGEIEVPAGAEVRVNGFARASAEPLVLGAGQVTEIVLGSMTVTLCLVSDDAVAPVGMSSPIDLPAARSVGASAFVHAAIFASLAFFLPGLTGDDDEALARDNVYAMQAMLDHAAEREQDRREETGSLGETAGPTSGSSGGGQAAGAAGKMGRADAPVAHARWSAKGDAKPEDATLARQRDVDAARQFGMLGLLNASSLSDPNAPVVPWGSALNGADKESHTGELFAETIGDAWGTGLGLSGTGEGGGGAANGIGLDGIGGLGHLTGASGTCGQVGCNGPGGMGHGTGHVGGTHTPLGIRVREPKEIVTNGRIPPEVIQRIVRMNAGRYRNCYENGLRTNPNLEGRVAVRFVIDRSGGVALANDGGSDLPDAAVRECVVKSFYTLSFPPPQGGVVNVTYPLLFSPAGT